MKADKAPRGKKGGKDPKAPKRALSAYMFFSQDWRERIKAENPDAGFGEWFFCDGSVPCLFSGGLTNHLFRRNRKASRREVEGTR